LRYVLHHASCPAIRLTISAVLTLKNLYRRYQVFKRTTSISASIDSALGAGFYLRLMALVGHEMAFTVPANTYFMVTALRAAHLTPFDWETLHRDLSHVIQLPISSWMSLPVHLLLFNRWIFIYLAFAFFAFFGFAPEARKRYRSIYLYLARRLGRPVEPATTAYTLHTLSAATVY
jgi:pheromone a factor receptor